MKSLLFLLLPILIYAQNSYKDTLFLTDGRSYPCLITDINDSKIWIVYLNNTNESIILQAVKRISLEEHGTVYLSDSGFKTDINLIQDFVHKRTMKIEEAQLIKKEQERLAGLSNDDQTQMKNDIQINKVKIQNKGDFKKWSFGVLYVPYSSGKIYTTMYSSYPYELPYTYGYINNETNMEAQLAFGVVPNVRLTLDVGYNSTFTETRNEEHNRQTGYNTDYGYLEKNGLDLLDINFGLKYYFLDFFTEQVSVYYILGVGKQFAFADYKYENLFPQSTSITEDNMEEYLEDLNSQWHFNMGFGAEYFFNESLSLTSNILFLYSKISGKYNYRYVLGTETRTRVEEYTNSEFITRIGLGLNFYF